MFRKYSEMIAEIPTFYFKLISRSLHYSRFFIFFYILIIFNAIL
jgi:hypothetical protein